MQAHGSGWTGGNAHPASTAGFTFDNSCDILHENFNTA
jgi:hypothetical protein